MTTLACTVSSTGITAPAYSTILSSLQSSFTSIYGTGAYVLPDSQDGQLLSILASVINDSNSATIAAYNQFSPTTSQGAGLSSVVKINGLQRLIPSNSTANLTIVGTIGTIITNGIAQDSNGYQWALPASVTIPTGGSIVVTATCTTAGAIVAGAGIITTIVTPTLGWQTVNNAAAAVVGNPVETDAQLRVRQSVSTGLPAQSVLGGIVGAIANITGVAQYKAYENDSSTTDSNGLPAHSISLVVQGGSAATIAQEIALKKTPGTGTYGTTTQTVTDSAGVPVIINFYVPTQVTIDVNITIKAYTGYVSTTGTLISTQVQNYINSLGIGGSDGYVFYSKLFAPIDDTGNLANTYNATIVQFRRGSNAFDTSDVAIAFNELPMAGTITITVT